MSTQNYIWTLAKETARKALDDYMLYGLEKRYLYYRATNTERPGKLFVGYNSPEPGEGWILACNEYVPRNLDTRLLTRWMYGIIRHLPILPSE